MPRPEKPITWDGPLADLAQALRDLRWRAGRPSYRDLEERTRHSRSVLADAAAGYRCPTWEVTRDFVVACGENPDDWRPRWELARAAAGKDRPVERKPRRPRGEATRAAKPRASVATKAPVSPSAPPDPELARTPMQFRYQLRTLRAWAGNPFTNPTHRIDGSDLWVPASTMYDALNVKQSHLPALRVVRAIVTMCIDDAEQVERWLDVWRAINMAEYQRANPPPPGLG
ncbi:hypothetical protein [Nonomuraea sp. B5E05]|uniref:hypothetical protein n=1 Tax=Nonomuraea sp. B5E05 TaxID=3153569 RepID=UPI003260DE11